MDAGGGGEVVKKFLAHVAKPDHLKFIAEIQKQYPLYGSLIATVSSSIQDKIVASLQQAAIEISERRMKESSFILADHMGRTVDSMLPRIDQNALTTGLRQKQADIEAREREVTSAETRFHRDLQKQIVVERDLARRGTEQLTSLRDRIRTGTDDARRGIWKLPGNIANQSEEEPHAGLSQPVSENGIPITVESLEMLRDRVRSLDSQIDYKIQLSTPAEREAVVRIVGTGRYNAVVRQRVAYGGSGPEVPSPKCCVSVSGSVIRSPQNRLGPGRRSEPEATEPVVHPTIAEHPIGR